MQIILENPYRIVGLLVGATAREQERQIKRLKQYIDAEQNVEDDFSFTALGSLRRSLDDVTGAASKLNLDSDKMSAALFWFYKGNPITDEPAFDAIKAGDLDLVFNIWSKLTSTTDVTHRNASAYCNLATLYLSGILEGTNTNEALLEQGISLKIKFLESDFVKDFKALASDKTFKTTKKELQLLFLNQVQSEIEKSKKITPNKLIDILSKQEFLAKEDFLIGFIQKPIKQIEKKIEEAKTKRKENKINAVNIGKTLNKQTSENLQQLKSILGASSIKYASIADKTANEILQCGIDYFSHHKESNTDPGRTVMDLFRKAKTLAVGNIAKQRCQENTENLQEWIDDKPERDKQKLIESDLKSLIQIIQEFENKSDTIENAKSLVNTGKPFLSRIKSILGNADDLYLKLSTRVAAMAQHNIIEDVNHAQENLEYKITIDRYGTIIKLKSTLTNAWTATVLVGTLDMEYDFKINRYNTNKESLKGLCGQLGISTSTYNSSSSSNSTNTNPSKSGSWASENTGCIWAIVIGAIILIISIVSNL